MVKKQKYSFFDILNLYKYSFQSNMYHAIIQTNKQIYGFQKFIHQNKD